MTARSFVPLGLALSAGLRRLADSNCWTVPQDFEPVNARKGCGSATDRMALIREGQ